MRERTYYSVAIPTLFFQTCLKGFNLLVWPKLFNQNYLTKIDDYGTIVSAWVPGYWFLLANHNPAIFFVPPGTEKRNKSPRQTKSPDNSSMLHMFNNKIYTDFRTAYKHVLIPICYSSDLTEPKCCKNNYCVIWLKQANINIWNWSLRAIFYFIFFDPPPLFKTCN